jgi:hypothetical protein
MQTATGSTVFIAPLLLALTLGLSARGAELRTDPRGCLDILGDHWPRVFFFRMAEGMATNPRVDYEEWERVMSRLQGIMGKVLDEEIPGRSLRNVEFFTRFKQDHPRQAVLLHYNGNGRDPRDLEPGRYFAGHWLHYTGCRLTADLKADSGDDLLYVEDVSLFHTDTGRFRAHHEDLVICGLDPAGRPDWGRAEQLQLLAKDAESRTLRVRRGCFGTRPLAFQAGEAYVAAHVCEGPWGQNANLMWYYNYAANAPRDADGSSCADRLVEELAGEFAAGGRLAAFDGVEFDVLCHERWQPPSLGSGRGVDCDGDGRTDNGYAAGRNVYGQGVTRFLARLRDAVGENLLLMADGHSHRHQRGFGILNGIESEGWPSLMDWEMRDWSGGLNRHASWSVAGRAPVFNYINHKYIDGEEGVFPSVPFKQHRLSLAAAQFTDAAVTYSFQPPGAGRPVWDELWQGVEQRLGWLGRPLGPARHLAAQEPDLLGHHSPQELADGLRPVRELARVNVVPGGVVLTGEPASASGRVCVEIPEIRCDGPDLFVQLTLEAEPLYADTPDIGRQVWLTLRPPGIDLIHDSPLPEGRIRLRTGRDLALEPGTGATLVFSPAWVAGDEGRRAFFCHPPYNGGPGATYWQRRVVLEEGVPTLTFAIGMGRLAPERSDGVDFQVWIRPVGDEAWDRLFSRVYNRFAWEDHALSLAAWAGREVELRFVTDCGPRDDPTTDHSAWADVRIVPEQARETRTAPERIMAWAGPRPHTSTFAFRRVARDPFLSLELEVEGGAPVLIRELSVHAAPDVVLRAYENGAVIANPSLHSVTVDLGEHLPGKRFRRIQASPGQDTEANSGAPVRGPVRLEERDALFLVVDEEPDPGH